MFIGWRFSNKFSISGLKIKYFSAPLENEDNLHH